MLQFLTQSGIKVNQTNSHLCACITLKAVYWVMKSVLSEKKRTCVPERVQRSYKMIYFNSLSQYTQCTGVQELALTSFLQTLILKNNKITRTRSKQICAVVRKTRHPYTKRRIKWLFMTYGSFFISVNFVSNKQMSFCPTSFYKLVFFFLLQFLALTEEDLNKYDLTQGAKKKLKTQLELQKSAE